MADTRNILTSAYPTIAGNAIPEFVKNDFDVAVHAKGYPCILEKALRCPCGIEHPQPNCMNCQGTGFFFINPLKTRALITGINLSNKYKDWSFDRIGTIAITVRDEDKENLNFQDRITLTSRNCFFSERLNLLSDGVNSFFFTTYKVKSIKAIHVYVSASSTLLKLSEGSYNINPNNPYCIIINDISSIQNNAISVYYEHEAEFRVIDLPHEIRSSWEVDDNGQLKQMDMPVQAVARRSHIISMQRPNFDGSGLIYNDNV